MTGIAKGAGVLTLAVALNGCSPSGPSQDDSGDIAGDQLAILSGRAAVGAPIANAPVAARCAQGEGFIETVTTDDSGGFEGQVETSSLPCALQVTGEGTAQRLHSYTDAPGTVNITPFTDLIIALTATITPTTWFDQEDRTTAVGELEQQKNLFLNTMQ
jgi:hypothetical protein